MTSQLRVQPGQSPGLAERDPKDRLGLADKTAGRARLAELLEELDTLHRRLWAEAKRSVLLVLQGLDAAGKDGAVRKVFTGINPQGVRVVSFKAPDDRERAQDYLWRIHTQCPARGLIGVFNRSHYEDVVAALLIGAVDDAGCARRYRHIREFERMLVDEGTAVVKAFLHISRDEQRERLQARIDDPTKVWKFQRADLDVRGRWDEYLATYDKALTETSTKWAPWNVIPADHKWVRDVAVASLLVDVLRGLDPQYPAPEPGIEGLVIN